MEWKKRQKAEHDNVMLLAMSTLPPKLKINTYQKNEDGRMLYFKSLSQMEPHTKYVLYMLAEKGEQLEAIMFFFLFFFLACIVSAFQKFIDSPA